MLVNEHTAICTNKVTLVPYCDHHVTTYHDWMKDPDIRVATASEPLSLDQEYEMQQSWRSDRDKLTFILCKPASSKGKLPDRAGEIKSMIGDVNMFVSVHEEDNSQLSLIGELELMIASKDNQRQGFGCAALLTFILYVLRHEEDIIKQFPDFDSVVTDTASFDYFVVKINEANGRSLTLFEKLGFKKTATVPNFFGEYELRHSGLTIDNTQDMLSKCGVGDYREIKYTNGTG